MRLTVFTIGWLVVWILNGAPHDEKFPYLPKDWLIALVVCLLIDIVM